MRIWRRLCCRNRIKIFCRGHMELKNIYSQMPYTYWMNQKYPFRQRIRFFWQKRSINWHDYCNVSLSSPHIPLLCLELYMQKYIISIRKIMKWPNGAIWIMCAIFMISSRSMKMNSHSFSAMQYILPLINIQK